jgi:WD40 repeat protein
MSDGSMSYMGVRGVTLLPDGRTLASCGADGQVLTWGAPRQGCLAAQWNHRGTFINARQTWCNLGRRWVAPGAGGPGTPGSAWFPGAGNPGKHPVSGRG